MTDRLPTLEESIEFLRNSRARLIRLGELNAPAKVIVNEKKLIRKYEDMVDAHDAKRFEDG